MNESYLVGISTGPINKTLESADTFKEYWISSFFFSEISRELLHRIYKYKKIEVFSPKITDKNGLKEYSEAIRYPDLLIFKVSDLSYQETENLVIGIIEEVKKKFKLDEIYSNYFGIEYVISTNTESLKKIKKSLVFKGNNRPSSSLGAREIIEKLCQSDNNYFHYKKFTESLKGANNPENCNTISFINKTEDYIMIYFDGNDIGNCMEKLYLEGNKKYSIASAALMEFSRSISMNTKSSGKNQAIPLYVVGDEGCILIPANNFAWDLMVNINDTFKKTVGKVIPESSLRFSVAITRANIPLKQTFKMVYEGLEDCKLLKNKLNNSQEENNILLQIVNSELYREKIFCSMNNVDRYTQGLKLIRNQENIENVNVLESKIYNEILNKNIYLESGENNSSLSAKRQIDILRDTYEMINDKHVNVNKITPKNEGDY